MSTSTGGKRPRSLEEVGAELRRSAKALDTLAEAQASRVDVVLDVDSGALALEALRHLSGTLDRVQAGLVELSVLAAKQGASTRQIGLAQNISPNTAAARIKAATRENGGPRVD